MDIAVDAPAALQGGQSRYLTKRLFSMAEVDMAGALQRLQESMDQTRLTLTQKVDALHAEIKAQERRIDDALSSQQVIKEPTRILHSGNGPRYKPPADIGVSSHMAIESSTSASAQLVVGSPADNMDKRQKLIRQVADLRRETQTEKEDRRQERERERVERDVLRAQVCLRPSRLACMRRSCYSRACACARFVHR